VLKFYAWMKPGDKQVDTPTSARMIGDVVLCTGGYTFTPASATSGEKGFWTKVVGKGWRRVEDSESELRRRRASVEPRQRSRVQALLTGLGGVTTPVSTRAGQR
jgi:uncharacterized LabA/DUF88 family protein